MQYFTLATLLLGLAAAAPTSSPESLERRACSRAYPRAASYPINIVVSQETNKKNAVSPTILFNTIPVGSYGCQLEVNFPAGYPIQSSGASQVNVFTVDQNNVKKNLFGTVTFASSPVAPTKYVINSAKCESAMRYKLEIASDTLPGKVAFASSKTAGLSMTYNC